MATQLFPMSQLGGSYSPGILMYRPTVQRQHGHGFGSFLSGLFRTLIPTAKKYVLPHAINAAKSVASDVINGRNLRESVRDGAKGLLKDVTSQVFHQKGNGTRANRKRKLQAFLEDEESNEPFKTQHKSKRVKKVALAASKYKKAKRYTSNKKRILKKSDFVTLFD